MNHKSNPSKKGLENDPLTLEQAKKIVRETYLTANEMLFAQTWAIAELIRGRVPNQISEWKLTSDEAWLSAAECIEKEKV